MDRRLLLHEILEEALGSEHVYFQPPANVKMVYPAIVYLRDYENVLFADNSPYRRNKRYRVIVIAQDPDCDVPDKIAKLPNCLFNRFYVADNLNHDLFHLYF